MTQAIPSSPAARIMLDDLAKHGPMTITEWAVSSHLSYETVKQYSRKFHIANKIHIGEMVKEGVLRPMKRYAFGPGKDSKKVVVMEPVPEPELTMPFIPHPDCLTAALLGLRA